MIVYKVFILLLLLIILSAIILHFKIIMLKYIQKHDTLLGNDYKFNIKDVISIILLALPGFSRIITYY